MSTGGIAHEASKTKGQRWPWIWFAYTGFFFLDPIFQPKLWLWAATLGVFAVFTAVFHFYVSTEDCNRTRRYWLIAATMVLGLGSVPWNSGMSSLFVFAASFLAFTMVGIKRILVWFGILAGMILSEALLLRHATPVFRTSMTQAFVSIFLMAIIGGSNILFAEHNRAEKKLRAAQEENVALAAVAERERIARDLHDVLGHTLSVIALKAELAGRLVMLDPARAAAEIGDVERMTRTALGEVREAIVGYRAQGLVAEIENARRALDSAGVTMVAELPAASGSALTTTEETVLALALREAVTNIVRHARAKTCRLRFVTEDGRRRLVVEDDGEHPLPHEGNGLRGMRQRVEAIGGKLSLTCERGTQLLIELPYRPEAAA